MFGVSGTWRGEYDRYFGVEESFYFAAVILQRRARDIMRFGSKHSTREKRLGLKEFIDSRALDVLPLNA